MIRPWRTSPATSSVRPSPRNGCSTWIRRGRSSIYRKMVRYYGYYSNVSRGKRQKYGNDDALPSILESQGDEKAFRRNWARLIQKIYEVDPLICPKCRGGMRIISFIEDPSVIRVILEHLGLWLARTRTPPGAPRVAPPGRSGGRSALPIAASSDSAPPPHPPPPAGTGRRRQT